MADILANLKTFQPDYGAGTNELVVRLKGRAKGLTGYDNRSFVPFLRQKEEKNNDETACTQASKDTQPSKGNQSLKIGIIGGGHIGKQLARILLQLSGISEKNIQISTRRPETLSEFQGLRVSCFYDNKKLVGWADIVFLCCLPSHLPRICSEVQDTLQKPCIIYSLVTGIPLTRLKQLLSSNSILRPQYKFIDSDPTHMWIGNQTVEEALKDPAVIQATWEIVVNREWLAAVFYAALNSYTWQCLSYAKALILLSQVCFPDNEYGEDKSPPLLMCENFINPTFASSLEPDDPLPWFDLTTVQLRDSPFGQLLATDSSFQDNIASFYCNMIAARFPTKNEDSMAVSLKKTSLSAVLLNPAKSLHWTVTSTSKAEEASSTDSEDI
ncbi:hypothetical protein JD844_020962 [Phrynosoma platyrhinos]|uniref:Pyrroline-5-carboxylate reductase catalytic N-terminal domain-containing protein n=1 Tax=Phrynosoma platyrhinos TaxID=52577 RepID=A0ABQ7SSY9_PHRPL|nr:hypothetical protein JD844_020962 [Phrynosoma platyrhinos]